MPSRGGGGMGSREHVLGFTSVDDSASKMTKSAAALSMAQANALDLILELTNAA